MAPPPEPENDVGDNIPRVGIFELDGELVDVNELLRKPYDDIAEAAIELPAGIEWLNQMLEHYLRLRVVDNARLAATKARVYRDLRSGRYAQLYNDKMTETALDNAVVVDEEVIQATHDAAESEARVERLRNTIRLLTVRLDILRTVESTRRHVDRVGSDIR